jgi:ribosome-binding protein aMBF1 (putative translation factor)
LGISDDIAAETVIPDYTKSVEEVFKDVINASRKAKSSSYFARQLAKKMGVKENVLESTLASFKLLQQHPSE